MAGQCCYHSEGLAMKLANIFCLLEVYDGRSMLLPFRGASYEVGQYFLSFRGL